MLPVAANMTVLLLVLVSITSATCFTQFSSGDAAKSSVYADAEVTRRPDAEESNMTVGENAKIINAVAK